MAWSGSLAPCSVNNDFAWLCKSWDCLQHCACMSQAHRVVWGYVVLCYDCCYGCCFSKEKCCVMGAVPARREQGCLPCLWIFGSSSLLARTLSTLGSGNSMNSVDIKTTGVTNKISNTACINYMPIKLTEMEKRIQLSASSSEIWYQGTLFVEKQVCVVYEETWSISTQLLCLWDSPG